MPRKLLIDTVVIECGYRFQVRAEDLAGGGWDYTHMPNCELCEGIIHDVAREIFPTVEVKNGD